MTGCCGCDDCPERKRCAYALLTLDLIREANAVRRKRLREYDPAADVAGALARLEPIG
jgi:hypothetical protein